MASNSVKLMCASLFIWCNQHTSSSMVLSSSSKMQITKGLALTYTFTFSSSAHQSPWMRSSCHTLIRVSSTKHVKSALVASLSHPWVTAQALCFMTPANCTQVGDPQASHTGKNVLLHDDIGNVWNCSSLSP